MLPPSDTGRRRLSSLPRLEFQTQPLNLQVQDSQADSRSPSSSPRLPTMASFSLVGALEFRSVISSLQQDAAGLTLSAFDSPLTPLTPYPGGHYHGYGHPRSRSRGSIHSVSAQTWETSSDVPLSDRSPLPPATSLAPDDSDHHTPEVPLIHIDTDSELPIPEISHIPPSPIPDSGSDVGNHIVAEPSQEAGFVLAHACHILFPTLHGFHAKSLLGKTAAILATPAVFALTITLPVVVGPYDSLGYRHEKPSAITDTLVTFEEDESEHLIDEVEEVHGLHFNKWLMALQCTLGPLFCVAVLLSTFLA
jgi:solute carrier family 24 (sodium/potassium/calcium exchanger), member 6